LRCGWKKLLGGWDCPDFQFVAIFAFAVWWMVYWNAASLAKMKGEKPAPIPADNKDTFNKFDATTWPSTAQKLDAVLTEMEHLGETADDAQLNQWASTIAHISAHNAYHVGQIIYVRKLQGSWDPEKGVKQ
jgi:hypothetical protein